MTGKALWMHPQKEMPETKHGRIPERILPSCIPGFAFEKTHFGICVRDQRDGPGGEKEKKGLHFLIILCYNRHNYDLAEENRITCQTIDSRMGRKSNE